MKEAPAKHPKNLTGKTIVTPEGKIRPGNRKPMKKATLEQMEERIDFCLKLLIRGATTAEIHKAMADRFDIHWRTIDDIYIVRARKLRQERAGISNGEARDFVITNLLDVVKTEKGSVRVSACAQLSEIFGCYAPKHHRFADPDGKALAPAIIAPVVNFIIPDNGRGIVAGANGNGNGHVEVPKQTNGR